MTRRFVSLILLAILVAAQSLPAGAQGMVCRMAQPTASTDCVRCDANAAGSSAIPAISAGSCCRFEPPRETVTLPGILAQSQRAALDDPMGSAVCAEAAVMAGAETRTAGSLPYLSARLAHPPSTSTTRLRL